MGSRIWLAGKILDYLDMVRRSRSFCNGLDRNLCSSDWRYQLGDGELGERVKLLVYTGAVVIGALLALDLPLLYPTLLIATLEFIIIMFMYFRKDIELLPGKQYFLMLQDKNLFGRRKIGKFNLDLSHLWRKTT